MCCDSFFPGGGPCKRYVVIASASETIQENLYSRKKQHIAAGLMKSTGYYKIRILTPGWTQYTLRSCFALSGALRALKMLAVLRAFRSYCLPRVLAGARTLAMTGTGP